MNALKSFLKDLKVHHYIVIAIAVGIGIFNAVTALSPTIKQHNREANIVKTFEKWWEEEGAAQFIAVGLKADEKTKAEEFEQYRERYLQQNHTFVVEDRIVEMKKEFREWWETGGGKEQYIQEHKIYPDERHFRYECDKWIKQYTDKQIRYSLAFTPKDGELGRLTTSWLLFPGVASYLVFLIFLPFAYIQTSRRWGVAVAAGCIALTALAGGFVVYALTGTSFFDHYDAERYMGMSCAIAFMLGATAFGRRKDSVPNAVHIAAFAGMALDVIINIFVNGGIFGAVALTSLLFFGLGVAGGINIPNRKRSIAELRAQVLEERRRKNAATNQQSERRKRTRDLINEGFKEASSGAFPAAKQLLSQAMTALLQEFPIDVETTTKLAERMTSPSLYIDVPSEQWLEWGETAKSKNCFEAALAMLEKGLSSEKNATLARRALYSIGEIRINRNLNPEEGCVRLKKVIELGENDILASQARRLLAKASDAQA